jgi:cytochrome c-type biogenesis protein CcmH/NrfG
MVKEGGRDDASRVAYGFRLTTGRLPKPAERDRLLSWLAKERAYFAQHPKEAGEWTMLGNVLLNLDEALTKE